ncbi:MAG: bifunctional demethylmenaquinone methyltransferase/2-methoxy-6-polyprenyl-1,4-benzoquinol methylase UbiE [Rhodothermales bacterium]|nr:bifunctional demethylmenaquinone methyltransferase/2-methoxy-6-polyprenyl-1,4-benzoquinol methylase UbiE [Rhodothermales bacterium]
MGEPNAKAPGAAAPKAHRPPVGQAAGKKVEVERMFDAIAPRYDLLNRVLSLGIDRGWRKRAVRMAADALEGPPERVLDVATGTADLAVEALSMAPAEVVGVDLSEAMLERGRAKLRARGIGRVTLQKGDAEALPFPDGHFDAALVAFGVRNFEDLQAGLREMRRVLRPGGVLVVLELSKPRAFPFRQLYDFYSLKLLPLVGRLVSGDRGAYTYLPESVRAFPDGAAFLRELERAGFADRAERRLTFGVASLYRGRA